MRLKSILYIVILFLLYSCATSNHGTFVSSTFLGEDRGTVNTELGKVTGVSKQEWFLYIFPIGKAPSTDEAISNAKAKIKGTKYLTDISIDNRTYWKFGYSVQVIEVKAAAYK